MREKITILKVTKAFFERDVNFKYLETALINQNCVRAETKSEFNSGNACHHEVQKLLSS